ncbi:hypothetical protein PI125_g3297 [Phytophthora idaei]|nr:hypothetical protein PI125_g3297 [Phytophthora idaei]
MIDPADISAMLQNVATWNAPSEISGADDFDPSSLMGDVFGISSRCSSPTTSPKYTKSASVADLTSDPPVSLPPPCDKTSSTATESTRLSDPSLPSTEPSREVLGYSGVDVMNLPAPVVRGKPKQEKVLYWASKVSNKRHVERSTELKECTTDVMELVHWAQYTTSLQKVGDILGRYPVEMNEPSLRGRAPTVELRPTTVTLKCSHPFVIPEDLVKSLTATLQTKNLEVQLNAGSKVCASSSKVLDVDASPEATKDLVVKFISAGPMFSSSYVDAMMIFYQFKKNTVNWKSDGSWLKDDWSASCGVSIELFAAEVGARGMSREQKRQLHCRLAHDLVER